MPCRRIIWRRRSRATRRPFLAIAAALLLANVLASQPILAPAAAAATQPPLLPAPGQFVSVPATDVLNTNTGLGESSAAPLAAGATFTIAVTGSDGVPSGATSVAVDVFARPASGSGFLSAYDPDSADPGVAMLGLASGANSERPTRWRSAQMVISP